MTWNGKWLYRPTRSTHRCKTPKPRLRVDVGAVWECRCGQQWLLSKNVLAGSAQHWLWSAQ